MISFIATTHSNVSQQHRSVTVLIVAVIGPTNATAVSFISTHLFAVSVNNNFTATIKLFCPPLHTVRGKDFSNPSVCLLIRLSVCPVLAQQRCILINQNLFSEQ